MQLLRFRHPLGGLKDFYGFEEWSETRIIPVLGNAVLEVVPKSFGPAPCPGEDGRCNGLRCARAWRGTKPLSMPAVI